MRSDSETRGGLPFSVVAVVILLAIYAFLDFRNDALPALAAEDADELWSASVDAVFALIILIGLLQRKSWAWWFAVFAAAGQLVFAVLGLGLLHQPDVAQHVEDTRAAMIGISVVGSLGILALFFLFQSETRAVFRR